MGSAGKWVLGLLLLVVGAVFVARAVSSDPESGATVKNNLQADPASVAKANADAESAKQKKIASTTAGDVACKKACIEVNEVTNESVTTAKLAPGSVTLSKLAFEVPNLNELENEINARKAAEAQAKVAASDLSAATAKNDAAITAAAANGLTTEAAARTAADQDLAAKTAAADADLLSKLNTEVTNRGAADDVLQSKLNTEIADRAAGISGLRTELANPNQVASPIVQINNNEIVANAVTTDKIALDTILANDLATGSVTTDEILDDTVAAVDLANNAVVGRAAGETLTNTKAQSLRGERQTNSASSGQSAGDLALGTLTGEGDNNTTRASAVGNLGLTTVGRNNLVNDAIDNTKIENNAVTSNKILDGEVKTSDINDGDVTNAKLRTVDAGGLNGAVSTNKINDGAVTFQKLDGSTQTRINNLETGLAAEIINRIADVDAEELARTNADTALQTALNNEIAARQAGDTAVQNNLNTEITNRLAKDVLQDTAMTNEVTARQADIAKLLAADPAGAPGPNDNDGFVNWDNLENIPTAILDADNKVSALKNALKTADTGTGPMGPVSAANDGDGLVDFTNIDGVVISSTMLADGAVSGGTGGAIVDGSITAADLAAGSVSGGNAGTITDGSITAADLAAGSVSGGNAGTITDGSITAADLAAGAVSGGNGGTITDNSITSDDLGTASVTADELAAGAVTTTKQTANAAGSLVGTGILLAVPNAGSVSDSSTTVGLTPNGADNTKEHVVQLNGQFQATGPAALLAGEVVTVTWQLFDGPTAVSPAYSDQITATDPTLSGSISQLLPSATQAGPTETTAKTYTLKITGSSVALGATRTVTVDNAVVTAVDLGRKP